MKKAVLSLLLLLSAGASALRAQIGSDFGVNMFMSTQAGYGCYHNARIGQTSGFTGSISVGKWILNPLAGRISLDLMSMPSVQNPDIKASFAAASVDFLWDPFATAGAVRDRCINPYGLIGLGVIYRAAFDDGLHTYGTDHEVQGKVGILLESCNLGLGWTISGEAKVLFLPEPFDGGDFLNVMPLFTLGVTHRFTESPHYRRTEFESRSTTEDWFLGFGFGPNCSLFDPFEKQGGPFYRQMGVAAEAMVGRNFSNFWTIRIGLTGLAAHEAYDTIKDQPGDGYNFTMLHADVMPNLSHICNFKRGVRLNILPYLGAGVVWRYDNIMFDMAADFGVMARYYLSSKGDLYADLKYLMVAPRVGGGTGPSGSVYGVGIPSLTFGYIHNFGKSTTRYRLPAHCVIDCYAY